MGMWDGTEETAGPTHARIWVCRGGFGRSLFSVTDKQWVSYGTSVTDIFYRCAVGGYWADKIRSLCLEV